MPSTDPRPIPDSEPERLTTGPYPTVPDPDAVGVRRADERRLAAVVEGMSEAFLSLDPEWRVTYANREACRLNDTTPAGLLGRDHWEQWPETAGSEVERQYRQVVATGVPARFEHYYPGVDAWHAIQAYPAEGGGLAVFYRDISADRAAAADRERLLEEAERARRSTTLILGAVGEGVLGMDLDGRNTFVNDAAGRLLGYAPEELRGIDQHERIHHHRVDGTPYDAADCPILETLRTGLTCRVSDEVFWRRDGSAFPVTYTSTPIVEGGRVAGAVVTFEDVTAQRTAEAELRAAAHEAEAAKARLAELFRQAPAFIAVLRGPDHVFDLVNDQYYQLVGHRDTVGKPVLEALPEVRGQRFTELLDGVLATGEPFVGRELPIRLAREPGAPLEERFVNFVYQPLVEADGTRSGVFLHGVDVTDQVLARRDVELARAAAHASESLARQLFAVSPLPTWVYDQETLAFLEVNEAALRQYGYSREEFLGMTLRDIRLPEDVEQLHASAREPLRSPGSRGLFRHRTRAGELLDVEVFSHDFRRAGRPAGIVVVQNVTERRRAEAALYEANRAAEAARAESEAARERTVLLQALTAALSTASTPEQVAEAVVAHATPVFGAVGTVIARLSADGSQLELMRAGAMPDAVRDEWRRFPVDARVPLADVARSGEPIFIRSPEEWWARYPGLEPMVRAAGHQANAVAPLVVDGRVLGVIGAAFDVPRAFGDEERAVTLAVAHQCAQALERARLYEAERAARHEAEAANRAKGEFLAVMSHELRTPLNAIGGYAELMEMGIRGPVTPAQQDDLRRIQTSQRHLLGLINEVLNYAKLETGTVHYDMMAVRVREALATAEALVAPQARAKGLTLVVAECAATLEVRADPEKLRQILVNLLSNAVKFTDPGGTIEMSGVSVGSEVHVRIRDTGIGIASDKHETIFDPFVQVRADLTRPHEGTGLGLAISRDLARGMGGDLAVESAPGAGSTFTLTLDRG